MNCPHCGSELTDDLDELDDGISLMNCLICNKTFIDDTKFKKKKESLVKSEVSN